MSAADVRGFTVGPVQENSFLVRAEASATRALLVDPGDEPERLLAAIASSRRSASSPGSTITARFACASARTM